MPTIASLDELAELIDRDEEGLYLRWSHGPEADEAGRSRDGLTGAELTGLSATALSVESWWGGRSRRLWAARRLHDYHHLEDRRQTRPWVLVGREQGRGPDNEPLVVCVRPVAWIGEQVVEEAKAEVANAGPERSGASWGTLDRGQEPEPPPASNTTDR